MKILVGAISEENNVPKISSPSSRRSIMILVMISVVAVLSSVLSYEYSKYTSERIASVATAGLESQGSIQAHDLSKSLENRLQAVKSNLQILASASSIKQNNIEARNLVNAAQETTMQFTDSYFWIDKEGKLLWANAFMNETIFNQYYGADRSDRPYFTEPRQNHQPYFSALRESVDGVPRIYMSYPILGVAESNDDEDKTSFEGVVVASFNLKTLAQDLNAQIAPGTQGSVSLMDRDGTILYTQNDALLGKNYFSKEVQDLIFSRYIPVGQQDSFNALLRDSLAGNSGTGHFSSSGVPLIIAYHPVKFGGSEDDKQHALALHVVVPATFASDIAALIDQQTNFSTIVPAAIGAVAIAIAFLILRWNRSLEKAVKERTAELVVANEQIQAHDKMQSEFVNIAAHELRTPIQPIMLVIDELKEGLGSNDKVEVTRDELLLMDRNAKRLQKLSSEILDATRIESGTLRLEYERVDINEKIQNAIGDVQGLINNGQKIKIQFNPAANDSGVVVPLIVNVDKLRIFEVISNLLRNAIKFTGRDGSGIITVTARQEGNQVRVTIKDTGTGISPEIMPRLFSKFSIDKEKGGTGLGLFIAKNIIEAHGGKIWAENNADGKGATFTFTLPLSAQV